MSIFGFGKNKETETQPEVAATEANTERDREGKKGRPTPKRKVAEKRNLRPLVLDKKAARAKRRKERDELYRKQREALDGTGDQRYLPAIDRGPTRKYIRDYVDYRYSIGEFVLPLVLFLLLISIALQDNRQILVYFTTVLYSVFAVAILEVAIITYIVNKKLLAAVEGNKIIKKGNGRYILMRQISPRFLRRPKALQPRGEKPDIEKYAQEIRSELRG